MSPFPPRGELVSLSPIDSVERAVQLVRRQALRRLPIVENGRRVGIVFPRRNRRGPLQQLKALVVTGARPAEIPLGSGLVLHADLVVSDGGDDAVVVFAHGSGSSRQSPRNRQVAARLQAAGFGTLLLDLLTEREEAVDMRTGQHRFDIPLLADRLVAAVGWLRSQPARRAFAVGYFGASTGAAAALVAAARQPEPVGAVVSRGGRPDLAADALALVRAPTLLVVGGRDETVLVLNQDAATHMRCEHRIEVVPGATHLFEEPGALERVADLAVKWFEAHLREPADRR